MLQNTTHDFKRCQQSGQCALRVTWS